MILGVDWGPLTLGSSGGIVQWLQGVFSAYIAKYPEDKILMFMSDEFPIRFDSSGNVEYYITKRRTLVRFSSQVLSQSPSDVLIICYPSLHFPDFPVERQIVVIPDMQHFDRPQFFTQKDLKLRRLSFGYPLANAGAIGTMTEFSRSSILAYPWTDCEDVFLMPPGVRFRAADVEEVQPPDWGSRIRRFSGFFFMPANPWPHKNHRNLFEAFSRALPALPAGTGLVLTGAGDRWRELFTGYETLPVEHLGYISQESLPFLYRRALALAFFSSYEGFGMPLLEAFHFGTPVVCSNIPALVEVGGDAVLTAPPDDPSGMAEQMIRIASDPALRAALVQRGKARLSRYSFHDSATALREAAVRVRARAVGGRKRGYRRLRISVLLDLSDPGAKLSGCYEALLRQKYQDFEILPFGGSVPKDPVGNPKLCSADRGSFSSPIAAAAAASGEVVTVVRGDCRLDTEALGQIAAQFDQHRDYDLIAVPTWVQIDPGERKSSWTMTLSEEEAGLRESEHRLFITRSFEERFLGELGRDYRKCRPLVAWRRRMADLTGSFDATLRHGYDADYTIRLVEAGAAVGVHPEPLATFVVSSDASAARYWYLVMDDLRRIVVDRQGPLRGRFFRLYRHRQRGLEPAVSQTWDLVLSLRAWTERSIWSARRSLAIAATGRYRKFRVRRRHPVA
jgi:glycosyltransferase involved in cell wall biosynthesis